VALGLPQPGEAPGLLQRAVMLAEAEAAIVAVEQWLGASWDPAPVLEPPSEALVLTLHDAAVAPLGTQLCLPAAALAHGAPPADLLLPAHRWPELDCHLVVDRVDPVALGGLSAGGLWWLPASFASTWAVRLVEASGGELQRHGVWWPQQPALQLMGPPEAVSSPKGWQLRLKTPVRLPLDRWLGWQPDEPPLPLGLPLVAELVDPGTPEAPPVGHGALMPLGAGWGWWCERLRIAEAAA